MKGASMTVAARLVAHPLAELVPPMADDEYVALRDDIADNGLRVPILLYEGKVLDGRHRLRACEETGTEWQSEDYTGDDPAREVMSLNLRRRNLSTSQRAVVAVELLPHFKPQADAARRLGNASSRGGRGAVAEEKRRDGFRTRDGAAAAAGVSGDTVYRAATVKEKDPDLFEQVKAGKLKVTTAYNRLNSNSNGAAAPAPKEPIELTGRTAQVAKAQRHRIDTMAGTAAAFETELPKLKIAEALMVASQEDVQTWSDEFERAAKALRAFARRLREG